MPYLEFENGKTPINDTNLNLMQTLISNDINGIVLFENENGVSSGSIQLSKEISSFKRLRIAFGRDVNSISYKDFDINNGKLNEIHLISGYLAEEKIYQFQVADISVSNKALTFKNNRYINITSNSVSLGGTVDYTKIFKVIGI